MGQGALRPVLVVGAGVAGLTAALSLRERGVPVRLWSADDPLQTTSAVAGAIWYPFLAEPRERVLDWGRTTFRWLQSLVADPAAGVRMTPVIEVFAECGVVPWWTAAVPAWRWLDPAEVPAGRVAGIRLDVPVCEVPVHLPWLVGRLRAAGVEVERQRLSSWDDAFAVADTVVNCAGLGARELCGDDALHAVRGQVVVVAGDPPAEAFIDDTAPQPRYVIPRSHDAVLGGSADLGDERLDVDDGTTAAIVADACRVFPALASAVVRRVRVGLRPCRPEVRLEVEALAGGRRLVHDYGHGGSGYTLARGCAEEVAALVLARG